MFHARPRARADKIVANFPYNPEHTAAHTADNTIVRPLLALLAAGRLHSDHFDTKYAFVQEHNSYTKPSQIEQLPKFDGTLLYPSKHVGVLMKYT